MKKRFYNHTTFSNNNSKANIGLDRSGKNSHTHSAFFTFLFIIIIEFLILAIVGYFLIDKFFGPKPVSKYLPAITTIGFAEAIIDSDSNQLKKLLELLKKYPVYQKVNLQKFISLYVSDLEQIKPWLGRKIAISFIVSPADSIKPEQISPVIFIEFKNYDQAIGFLKSKALSTPADTFQEDQLNNFKLFSLKFGQNYKVLVVDNYLIISDNLDSLQQIADVKERSIPSLSEDPIFNKANLALPQNSLLFAYIDSQKAISNLTINKNYLTAEGKDLLSLLPFARIFTADVYAIIFDENQLKAYQLTFIDKKQLGNKPYLTFPEKYSGQFLSYIPANSQFFLAGHNLKKEYNKIEEIFSASTDSSNLIFQGLIENQKNLYFGKNITIDEDMIPLLEEEYLLSFQGILEQPSWLFILELKDPTNDHLKISKLLENFKKKAGIFDPQIETVTLPDKTKAKDFVASSNVQEITANYNSLNYQLISIGENLKLYYLIAGNKFIFSNNLQDFTAIIDKLPEGKSVLAGQQSNLKKLPNSFQTVDQLLTNLHYSDEVISFNPSLFFNKNSFLKPYLDPIKNIIVGRSYFDDGIATNYLFELQ